MASQLLAKKPLNAILAEASETGEHSLKRSLGPINLVTLGIGAIIGTGIFVLSGTVAATSAGPAIILSFIIAGIGCVFAGLCYAEFSALLPIAGSAYTYGYATLGEIVAWIIGWALVLEYAFGAATVAVGWGGYVCSFLQDLGLPFPANLSYAPGTVLVQYQGKWDPVTSLPHAAIPILSTLPHTTSHFDLVALIGILGVTAILVKGIKESANVNSAIVIVKVSVLLIFIGLGAAFLASHHSLAMANWHPFIPPNKGHFGEFGWTGILRGAGIIFFAYIGFDAVSTAAQETKNPARDMPIGILGSLVICTILYILVALVLTGLVSYTRLNVAEPIALGVDVTGVRWGSFLVKIGAIGGLSSTMIVMLLGQTRVFFTMAHDGLLGKWACKVHPKMRTPYISTTLIGICVAILAASLPITKLDELVSIGTLFAFTVVCAGVWILRKQQPNLHRPFRTPWVPFVPIMGMTVSLLLMFSLHLLTWEVFLIWLAIGLVIYFTYGRRHSTVQLDIARASNAAPARQPVP
ncbi:MAG TPA: amino acid permease [Candidatus Acidoferrales bacterium]|nr:amino acid permease [Candidatus Acidoferrales bacterium]